MKNALLAVSFGTAYPDALALSVAPTEQALAAACPGWPLHRAFTGDAIRRRLRREGLEVDSVPQAMEGLAAEGVTQVAVQPLYVTRGAEYERLRAQLAPWRQRMGVALGAPLLHSDADFETVAEALPQWLPPLEEGEALVLMGHGSSGSDAYSQLERVLQTRYGRCYVAVLEGAPTLERVLGRLSREPEIRKLMLAPFLLTPGGHARKDLLAWEATLSAAGYPVRPVVRGLGQCPRIRELYAAHCLAAVGSLERIKEENP